MWFRWPQGERQIKYPFITIDAITAEPAYELFHSNHYRAHRRACTGPRSPPPCRRPLEGGPCRTIGILQLPARSGWCIR